MASSDLAAFLRERAAIWDDTGDYSEGSPFDLKVVQPLVRRLGADPFSVDFFTFAQTRINEAFPDVPTNEGDAITDLLIKIAMVLWDPILREIQRTRQGQSLRDPEVLTVDEAEALCANLFSQRKTGNRAKGRPRIFFTQPQNASVSPANFFSTKTGLIFPPTENQSISVNEMLFNKDESGLYYFDVSVIADASGDEYNIGPDEIVTVANMASAVRVTNPRRFRDGNPEEDATTFVDRTEQELTERSMVTLRGVTARVTQAFPEINRLGVVGFNDPEMQRDVLRGGGLGAVRAAGLAATAVPDGENQLVTRRLDMTADLATLNTTFTALIGPSNAGAVGWVLTLLDPSTAPYFQDIPVRAVVGLAQIDLALPVVPTATGGAFAWTLRRKEITLSSIPGGILFPDSPNGTVTVPDDVVHIGGATDILVRGADLDSTSVIIENLTDDSPVLSGLLLAMVDAAGHVSLGDIVLDSVPSYLTNGAAYHAITDAALRGYSLQILDNPIAGTYRILEAVQTVGAAPVLRLDPAPAQAVGLFRWRLLDEIDIDLVEPKETRISGTTLVSVQGSAFLGTNPPTNFALLGVSPGDVLRIKNGSDAMDYTVLALLADQLQVDRALTTTSSEITYTIFRKNPEGGVVRPLVRVTAIDLLDTSGQPVGSKVPFARAVDVQSTAFANFAHGVKVDVRDARLGLVSLPLLGGASVSGLTLDLVWLNGGPQSIAFTGTNPVSLASMVTQINTTLGKQAAFVVEGNRLGITSLGGETQISGGTARALLFGTPDEVRTSRDVRSASVEAAGGWTGVVAADATQVLDGFQVGFYGQPQVSGHALLLDRDFAPEASRHVRLGGRSVGVGRVFFLEPTSVSFDAHTRFSTVSNGVPVRFLPDPAVGSQRIPAKPSGDKPKDGVTASLGNVLTSNSLDFTLKNVLSGDVLTIDYVPLTGTIALPDPVPGLASSPLTYLVLSVDNGADRVVSFVRDAVAIPTNAVTRAGIADQINQVLGRRVCSIVTVGGSYYLEFELDGAVTVRKTGTANSLLGFSAVADQNNDSAHRGVYTITDVAPHALTVAELFPNNPPAGSVLREQYTIFRPGLQRFCATEMALQTTDAGLFYVDVELVSEGTGDLWNIPAGLQLMPSGYASDGYWLTTDDANLTFSTVEPVRLHLSRSILEVGVSDDPENATQLSGQNIQVTYDQSTLTRSVSNFVSAETERVICESPLARHLIPYFVRFTLSYAGGSASTETSPLVDAYVRSLLPDDFLEVSAIEKILSDKGATSITNPVTLIAIVHRFDRTVVIERSQDRLNTGRLAAFIPDGTVVTRRTR